MVKGALPGGLVWRPKLESPDSTPFSRTSFFKTLSQIYFVRTRHRWGAWRAGVPGSCQLRGGRVFPGSGRGNSLPTTLPTGATAKSELLIMYFRPIGDFQDSRKMRKEKPLCRGAGSPSQWVGPRGLLCPHL